MPEQRDPRARQRDHAHRLQRQLEANLLPVIQQALDTVADQFARQVLHTSPLDADEVTAQALDPTEVDRIRNLWALQVPSITAVLSAVYETSSSETLGRFAGQALLNQVTEDPQHPVARTVANLTDQYLATATNRLVAVGDSLWEAARSQLVAGNLDGDSIDQLTDRLRRAFAVHGQELGETRAERIARTETVGAWDRASLDTAHALPEDDRPGYKTWAASLDTRTRSTHFAVDGTTVPLDGQFNVGGVMMDGPHDPAAPAEEVINCRCDLIMGDDPNPMPALGLQRQYKDDDEIRRVLDHFAEQGITRDIDQVAAAGTLATDAAGAARPGDPTSGAHMPGLCHADLIAAARAHDGAMIALVPTDADALRLAVEGGEPAGQLHLTLAYLGKAADWTPEQQRALLNGLQPPALGLPGGPIEASAFGAAHWNPGGEYPAWVLNVGGGDLEGVHDAVWELLRNEQGEQAWPIPDQHTPWSAHVCITYDPDPGLTEVMEQRLGPIVFDRLRIGFADVHTDIPLTTRRASEDTTMPRHTAAAVDRQVRRWHTPEPYALAFEDTETGDGRIFAAGAIRWEGDRWPLQYADEMLSGHDGAELAGDIQLVSRAGRRLAAAGDLYVDTDTGMRAVNLLERDAPLGVSVDLDDVTVELVDTRPPAEREAEPLLAAVAAAADGRVTVHLPHLSVMHTDTGNRLAGPLRSALTPILTTRWLTAAGCTASAGDPDTGGEVLLVEQAGEILMRITDARLRGATLVSIPALSEARIALVNEAQPNPFTDQPQPSEQPQVGELMMEVIDFVAAAAGPVRPGQVAEALGLAGHTARTYLSRAHQSGRLARPARGLYTAVAASRKAEDATGVTAAAVGNLRLPVHPERNRPWDGPAAASRVLEWANTQAEESDDPPSRWLAQAFLYQDPDGNPNTLAAYRLGFADIIGGELSIVARGVFATAGGRGVDAADIPDTDKTEIRDRICDLYRRLANEFDEDDLVCPWRRDDEAAADPVVASAWAEFDALPPLPASWFAEPTHDELPADSGGVHITDDGRIYGWVAQRGVPHEGYPGRELTIDDLQPVDTTWFLRKKFRLDNGDTLPLGPFVMNVGHHRDGGNCETQACLWDDSRTIAGLITVGFNDRGMWFSGAAAPWLSDWDKMAFLACQPSYHMTAKPDGGYKLGAVLAVPRPGHPSRLVAAAVVDRVNLLLTPTTSSPAPDSTSGPVDLTQWVPAIAAAVVDEQERRQRAREEAAALQQEMAEMRTELVAAMRAEIEGGH